MSRVVHPLSLEIDEMMLSTKLMSLALLMAAGAFLNHPCFATETHGADRHVARGVSCQSCHGSNLKEPEIPQAETCIKCHDKKKLAEKTSKLKPTNPHTAPHNDDCTLCHVQHSQSVDYCAQCHQFGFKVP